MKPISILASFLLTTLLSAPLLTAQTPPATPPRVAKVQVSEWTVVAERKGWFAEEFAKYGATAEVVRNNQSGNLGVEVGQLQRGELDFALRMQYPSLQQKINGLDSVIVWQSGDVTDRRVTIVVPKNSPIHSLADLKGKKLGAWRISCPYFASFEALKAQGLNLSDNPATGDVQYVNIAGPSAISSLLSGQIDALAVHPAVNVFTSLYTQGLVREIGHALDGGVYVRGGGRTSYFVPRDWANENPDLVKAFLTVYEKTRLWIQANPDAAAEIIAQELREPLSIAKYTITDDSAFIVAAGQPDYQDAIASIERFQNWAIANGDDFYSKKSLSHQELESFIDKRFFQGGAYFVSTADVSPGTGVAGTIPPAATQLTTASVK